MLLQVAIDRPEHLGRVADAADAADILEAGTPLLKRFGVSAISAIRDLGGGTAILADTKTVDGGLLEAAPAFAAGAGLVTVLTRASAGTIDLVAEQARRSGGDVVLDTICEVDRLDRWIAEAEIHPGCGIVNLHCPSDETATPSREQAMGRATAQLQARGLRVSVAGGIDRESLPRILRWRPDIIVVGRAILDADNPKEVATWMKNRMRSA